MVRPRLLDLFCGAGGCAVGYHRAGFDVVGVDHVVQKRYPFEFVLADALEYLQSHGKEFDAIHASPPCQRYSVTSSRWGRCHADLYSLTRDALNAVELPWVIENVQGAPNESPAMLCGTMFNLKVFRHRYFEGSFLILCPSHVRHRGSTAAHSSKPGKGYRGGEGGYITVAGKTHSPAVARKAMGIDWMTGKELAQAIPPAYTHFIGRQLLDRVLAQTGSEGLPGERAVPEVVTRQV